MLCIPKEVWKKTKQNQVSFALHVCQLLMSKTALQADVLTVPVAIPPFSATWVRMWAQKSACLYLKYTLFTTLG